MARGWESKSIEAQQADALQQQKENRPKLTPQEAARFRERENLRLSRQRVLQQLETSQNQRHRRLLQNALAELDGTLKNLEA